MDACGLQSERALDESSDEESVVEEFDDGALTKKHSNIPRYFHLQASFKAGDIPAVTRVKDRHTARRYRQYLHSGRLEQARKVWVDLGNVSRIHRNIGKQSDSLLEETLLLGHFDLAKEMSSQSWYRESVSAEELRRLMALALLVGCSGVPAACTGDGRYSTAEILVSASYRASCPFCPSSGFPLWTSTFEGDKTWKEVCRRHVELRQAVRDDDVQRVEKLFKDVEGVHPSYFVHLPLPCDIHMPQHNFEAEQVLLLSLSAIEIAACLGRTTILNCFFEYLQANRSPQVGIYGQWELACRIAILSNKQEVVHALRQFHTPSYKSSSHPLAFRIAVVSAHIAFIKLHDGLGPLEEAEVISRQSVPPAELLHHSKEDNSILDELDLALRLGHKRMVKWLLSCVHQNAWTTEPFIHAVIRMAICRVDGHFCRTAVNEIIEQEERRQLFSNMQRSFFPLPRQPTDDFVCFAMLSKSCAVLSSLLVFSYHSLTDHSWRTIMPGTRNADLLMATVTVQWERGTLMLLEAGVPKSASLMSRYPRFVAQWQPNLQQRCLHVIRKRLVWLSWRNVQKLPLTRMMKEWLLFKGSFSASERRC